MTKLPPRQEDFCQRRHRKESATDAYINAGYKAATRNAAGVAAHKLLKNAKIQKRLAELAAEMKTLHDVKMAEVVDELRAVGFSDVNEYITQDEAGRVHIDIKGKDTRAISTLEITNTIKGMEDSAVITEQKVKMRLWDKTKALQQLGRYTGAFAEDNKQASKREVTGEIKINRSGLTPEQEAQAEQNIKAMLGDE